jgi:hypothetical protein
MVGLALEGAWRESGYTNATYKKGRVGEALLRTQLETTGPVQIGINNLHVMLLDRWSRGSNGTVKVRLMDPKGPTYHVLTEEALRAGSPEVGKWTHTVFQLESHAPSNCGAEVCGEDID